MQKAAKMANPPEVVGGWSVEGKRPVEMCIVGLDEKQAILLWATEEGGGYEPTILVNPKSMRS